MAKWPAASAVSLIPKRAHSIESTRVRFSTAARAADEWAMPGSPWCGERVTLTILPPRASGIIARVATAWVISQVPSTFRRMTVRKPFGRDVLGGGHVLAAGVVDEQVDLAVALEHRVHERLDLVLLADVADVRLDAPAVGLRRGLRRAAPRAGRRRPPRAPSAASSSALARPSPEPPPLTIATWPSSSPGWKSFEGMAAGQRTVWLLGGPKRTC